MVLKARDATETRRIVLLSFPGVLGLDLVGPAEVFSSAALIRPGAYTVETVGVSGPHSTSSGLGLLPTSGLPRRVEGIDTLVVPGGTGVSDAEEDAKLIAWLRRARPRRGGSRRSAPEPCC